MALTTYEEVKSAIAAWLSRDDLAARIPDFITMFEARANRILRTNDMEFRAELVTVAGDDRYTLPAGFRGMRSLRIISTDPKQPLKFMSPQSMDSIYGANETRRPAVFAVVANELRLVPTPDMAYTLSMIYHKGITPLADAEAADGSDKWLLNDHPDLYIHGPMKEAQVFIQRDQRSPLFEQEFQMRMDEIKTEARKSRHSAGPLQMTPEFTRT